MLLALAANTSFGGLPVLAQLLAKDNNLPHAFALRAEHSVHRQGIAFLTVTSALLLIVADGQMNLLVPLFAIGVFVGFTLSQAGMVRYWLTDRPRGWAGRRRRRAPGRTACQGRELSSSVAVQMTGNASMIAIIAFLVRDQRISCGSMASRRFSRYGRRLVAAIVASRRARVAPGQ